jgi:two-component system sensor histidine kinase CreC
MRRRLEGREQLEHDVRALTHELKSPLAALRASGELLQDELPAADRQRFAAQVLDQTARLQTLVERVLALSQLEAQKGLGVRWTAREDVAVDADAALLELAFGNLLVNAIDFAPVGSTLELAVSTTPTSVCLTLRDHGPGVPAAAFQQLGKRFFSTARPGSLVKGSGLGLAIARRVAELHGGRLVFEAAEPGLKVTLILPR